MASGNPELVFLCQTQDEQYQKGIAELLYILESLISRNWEVPYQNSENLREALQSGLDLARKGDWAGAFYALDHALKLTEAPYRVIACRRDMVLRGGDSYNYDLDWARKRHLHLLESLLNYRSLGG